MSDPFIGEIGIFAGNFAPRGWAFCNGQLLGIAQNTALFSIFGTIYGGDGRTTFGLPNLQARAVMHPGHGPGLTSRTLGEHGGVTSVALNLTQLPQHTHAWMAAEDPADLQAPGPSRAMTRSSVDAYQTNATSGLAGMSSMALPDAGGSQPHDNWQPYIALNYIVALVGVFPSRS